MSGVYVVLEDRGGRIGRISWEAVAAANILAAQSGAKATAIVIGAQTEALATEAATKGVANVVRIEHPLLAQYTSDGFTLRSSSSSAPSLPTISSSRTPTRFAIMCLPSLRASAASSSAT